MSRSVQARIAIIPVDDLNAVGEYSDPVRIPQDLAPVLAVLSGISEDGPRMVSITPNGAARVADVGRGYTHMEPYEGTLLNNTATITFTNLISSLVINVDAQQLSVQLSENGQDYDPTFTILGYEKVSIDILCRAIKLTNLSTTVTAGYRVWGLYF